MVRFHEWTKLLKEIMREGGGEGGVKVFLSIMHEGMERAQDATRLDECNDYTILLRQHC